MLQDNLKRFRKEKGMSQEELAVKLHVVRQTVSKWETALSVPDAEMLIQIGRVLGVSVEELLGVEHEKQPMEDLAGKLAELNQQLAERIQKEALIKQANEKRVLLGTLGFISFAGMLVIRNPVVSLLITGIFLFIALVVLYRNLALLTCVTTEDMKLTLLRFTTLVNIGILLLVLIAALLSTLGVLQFAEQDEKIFALCLFAGIMVFVGIISPKLPYSRHTGLRLPWTIADEEAWNVAHRILGWISLPLAVIYVACALTIEDFEKISMATMLVWIGIPGGISGLYYYKKYR